MGILDNMGGAKFQYGLLGLAGLSSLMDNRGPRYTTNIAEATTPRDNPFMAQLPGQMALIARQEQERKRNDILTQMQQQQLADKQRQDQQRRAFVQSLPANTDPSTRALAEIAPEKVYERMFAQKDPKRYVVGGALVDDAGTPVYKAPEKPTGTNDITEYEYAAKGGYKGSFSQWMADKRAQPGTGMTDDLKEYQFAKGQGFKGAFEEWQRLKRGGSGEYGMQPIWGVGPDGQPAVVQLGKGGAAVQSKMPEGFKISSKPIEVDTANGTVLLDPQTRNQIGFIPKNIADATRQKEVGAATGQAQATLPASESTAATMKQYIEELRNHPGRGKATGPIVGRLPPAPGEAYDFNQRFEQVKGQAFLKAFESLRGAGSITENEGQAATKAISRMDRASTKEEFDNALNDLQTVVDKALNVQRTKAGAAKETGKTATMADVRYTALQNKVSEAEVIKRLKAQGYQIEGGQ